MSEDISPWDAIEGKKIKDWYEAKGMLATASLLADIANKVITDHRAGKFGNKGLGECLGLALYTTVKDMLDADNPTVKHLMELAKKV